MELDALPDELLVEIFSLLDDGKLLLDCVSLVCKRWRRLAMDWRSWTGVRLKFTFYNWRLPPEDVGTMDNARVLLHAPALGSLIVDLFARPQRQGARLFESAARRSRAVLLGLESYCSTGLSTEVREALYGLLWRSRNHLRVLRPELPLDWDPAFHDTDSEDEDHQEDDFVDTIPGEPITVTLNGEEVSLMGILAQLQRLETLSLELHPVYRYIGELRGARLPRLKELDLNFSDPLEPLDLAVDLVNAASDSLQSLKLPHGLIPKPMLDAVSGCAGLHHLEVGYVDLPVVAHLHQLSKLDVKIRQALNFPEMTVETVAAVRRALPTASVVLGGLSELNLEVYDYNRIENSPDLRAELLLLVTDTLRATPNVTSLTLSGKIMFKEVLAELPAAFVPRVRQLRVRCDADTLAACSLLPELRELDMYWYVAADQADETAAKEAAVKEFRRLRPDVVVKP